MNIKFFKKENSFKKKSSFDFNPNLYWEIAVGVVVLAILGAFVFGYFLFLRIGQESTFSVTNKDGGVPRASQARIDAVLNYFSEREQKSTKILNSPVPVVDPSL